MLPYLMSFQSAHLAKELVIALPSAFVLEVAEYEKNQDWSSHLSHELTDPAVVRSPSCALRPEPYPGKGIRGELPHPPRATTIHRSGAIFARCGHGGR